jgi:uncharacterized repeat protein (TIGR03803 family)
MMNKLRIHSSSQSNSPSTKTTAFLAAIIGALLLAAGILANAQSDEIPTYSVLYTFTGDAEGAFPQATNPLAMDREGNLYGVSANGGVSSNVGCGYGCGSVFEVSRDGKESIEYEFTGVPTDSQRPDSNVIRDEEGNLYGTAFNLVYKISRSGHETELHNFTGGIDGGENYNVDTRLWGLVRDREGNLYGAAPGGGLENGCPEAQYPFDPRNPPLPGGGCGVIYKIDPRGRETVLYTFTGGADGGIPQGALVRDEEGNLYGTTLNGGNFNSLACRNNANGCGVIFKVDRHGKETVLHTFDALTEGNTPTGLVRDRDGTLYGTSTYGGNSVQSFGDLGYGVVYKLDASGKFTVLHNFTGLTDGEWPTAPPLLTGKDLYGAAAGGGTTLNGGYGVIYKLDRSGNDTVLYRFKGQADGSYPASQLTLDEDGNLYGTTEMGGNFETSTCKLFDYGCGVVYKLDLHKKCDNDRHRHNDWPNIFSKPDDSDKDDR